MQNVSGLSTWSILWIFYEYIEDILLKDVEIFLLIILFYAIAYFCVQDMHNSKRGVLK